MSFGHKGLSIGGVQGFNRRVMPSAMLELGPCSRKAISVATGLDQATVTRAIALLIEDGIVEEVGLVKGGRGRRTSARTFERIVACVDRHAARHPRVDGMGVAVPGPFVERDDRVPPMTESPDRHRPRSRALDLRVMEPCRDR